MKKLISVIVPVYNVEKYLERCVKSIMRQSYQMMEIILVDDGSSDGSPQMCDEFAKMDSRIRAIHQKNMGVSVARNVGIEAAKGEYIGFVDSDDCIAEDMYERLISLLEENDAGMVMCEHRRFETNPPEPKRGRAVHIMTSMEAIIKLHKDAGANFIFPPNKVYKRDVIANIRFPEGKINEDEFIIYRYMMNAKKIVLTEDILYFYFRNGNSITGNSKYIQSMDIFEAFDERYRIMQENNMQEVLPWIHKAVLNRIITRYRMASNMGENSLKKKFITMYRERYRRIDRNMKKVNLGIGYIIFYFSPQTYLKLVDIRKR